MSATRPGLLVVRDDLVLHVELDRPERGNALDGGTVESLHDLVDTAANDGTRVVVLGSTDRIFCAGLDLSGLRDETDASLLYRLVRIELLLEKIWTAPFFTVAMVAGPAVGAGADLVIAASVRYATTTASLRFPGSEFGAVLGVSRLAGTTTAHFAAEVGASGRIVSADEASHLGIWQVVGETLDAQWQAESVHELAGGLLRRSPETILEIRREVGRTSQSDPLGVLVRSLASHPGLADRVRAMSARRSTSKTDRAQADSAQFEGTAT